MKKKSFLLPLLAALSFTGCSSDEPAMDNGGSDTSGRTAYLSVRIKDAGTLSRGTGNGDKPFELGTADEHAVKSADFYFYDASGNYVAKGNAWNGGSATATEGDLESSANVEFKGLTTVILKGLTGTGYPKYVVTVLNRPSDFYPDGKSLTEMQTLLAQQDKTTCDGAVKYTADGKQYFIMSTTSYGRDDTNVPYYVTELTDDNFTEETSSSTSTPVDIYVERLAAKVRVSLNTNDDSKLKPVAGKDNTFELTMTIAGKDNKEGEGVGSAGNLVSADTKVYVTFTGWGLNATTKNSYMMKNITPTWTENALGFAWNDKGNFRSYWGMSYNYGKSDANYPTSNAGITANAPKYTNYFSYNSLGTVLGNAAYCPENTNTSDIVTNNMAGAVTSVLLAAKVTADVDGAETLDLVHYNTVYFTKDAYIVYAMSALSPNVYTRTGEAAPYTYNQLQASSVDLKNDGDGYVVLNLTEAAEAGVYYEKNADGNYTEIEDAVAKINGILAGFNTGEGKFKANAFNGGMMYYNIPIEHLNDNGSKIGNDKIDEAVYGIVRNHVYNVTVNSLSGLGKGVYDPSEQIVPDDPKTQKLYYVDADINILSWKIVNQGVDL